MSITGSAKSILFSSGGAQILLGLLIFFIIIGIIGYVGWRIFNKKYVYRYGFLMLDSLGNIKEKKGKITRNPQQVEVFEIEGIPNKHLPIKEPNLYFNGKPKRVIAYDGMGEISWCTKIEIDKVDYLKTALTPPERQMGAQKAIEAGQKYGRMPNELKFAIGFSVIVIFIMIIGMYANGKLSLMTTEKAAEASSAMVEITKIQERLAKSIEDNTKFQQLILKNMAGSGYNISLTAD